MKLLFTTLLLISSCFGVSEIFYSKDKKYFVEYKYSTVYIKEKNGEETKTLYSNNIKKKINKASANWRDGKVVFHYGGSNSYGGIYDTKTNKLICENHNKRFKAEDQVGWLDEDEVFTQNIRKDQNDIYSFFTIYKDRCLLIDVNSSIKEGDLVNPLNQDKQTTNFLFNLLNAAKMYKAGFDEMAIDKMLALKVPSFKDYPYENPTIFVENNAPIKSMQDLRPFINIFMFQEYNKQKLKDIDILFSSRYIFRASLFGYKKAEKAAIDLFEKYLKENPNFNTQDNKEALLVYKANYLLGIGKEKEGYNLLIANMPFQKSTRDLLLLYSGYQFPLMKDTKKLTYIFELEKSKLSKPYKFNEPSQFIMPNGTILKKENKEKIETKKEKPKKKSSVELLD